MMAGLQQKSPDHPISADHPGKNQPSLADVHLSSV